MEGDPFRNTEEKLYFYFDLNEYEQNQSIL